MTPRFKLISMALIVIALVCYIAIMKQRYWPAEGNGAPKDTVCMGATVAVLEPGESVLFVPCPDGWEGETLHGYWAKKYEALARGDSAWLEMERLDSIRIDSSWFSGPIYIDSTADKSASSEPSG